ncbi:MAG: zinc ribbon domain-containing protein [Chloroflexota bacterium]
MPIYDYTCAACGRRVSIFLSYNDYDSAQPVCTHCGSNDLHRRVGRVTVSRSESSRLDSLMDSSSLAGLDEDDPRALGQFMRQMGQEMGEDLGDEFGEVVSRLESGESPEAIERAMPDLGNEGGLFADE